MKTTRTVALGSVLLSAACSAQVGLATDAIDLPRDAAKTCSNQCEQLGLTMDGVVLSGVAIACACGRSPTSKPETDVSTRTRSAAAMLLLRSEDTQPAAKRQSSESELVD